MQPSHHFIQCQQLEVHYSAWGPLDAPVVVCWHGLTRTGRDFDCLARELARDYRVICPDTPGRGWSQWLSDPQQYVVPYYAQLAITLLDQLGVEHCAWVGTSMGGLIGMVVAGLAPARISRMVLNDVGPEVPVAAVERIRAYAGLLPAFATLAELEAWLRKVYVAFGTNSDAYWQDLAQSSARRQDNGQWTLHYDPRLTLPFQDYDGSVTLWELWPALQFPLLIIRGGRSDVLLAEHAQRMVQTNPWAQLVTYPELGHAPALATPEQITLIQRFLQA